MKKKLRSALTASIVILLLIACNQKTGNKNGTISGKLSNASGTMVYLERFDDKGEYVLDSVKTDADGNFKLNNKATEKDYYVIRTDRNNLVFLLTYAGENIEITGDGKNMENTYTVKGSKESELIRELKSSDKKLSDSLLTVYSDMRDKMPEKKDSVGAVLQRYYAATMENFGKAFIIRNPKSLVSLSATRYLDQEKDTGVFENLLASLSKEYPGNKYVKDFESMVTDLKKLPVGSLAPEIRLNTPEGKQISLSSLKGKIVLVDFWASWCAPCRKENPHVVEMYRKFKSKNFEVFGVSLDDNVNAWKEAIRKDGLQWTQVSELKKWNSEVVKDYRVEEIPYTVLIDKDGKIIAKGLTGDQLEQKLIEIL